MNRYTFIDPKEATHRKQFIFFQAAYVYFMSLDDNISLNDDQVISQKKHNSWNFYVLATLVKAKNLSCKILRDSFKKDFLARSFLDFSSSIGHKKRCSRQKTNFEVEKKPSCRILERKSSLCKILERNILSCKILERKSLS